jgi:anti-sigma factor RsiW
MCDFSGRLVAWMDRELPDNEAADVERHVRECSECRGRVDTYEEVSRAFVAYCDAAMEGKTHRRLSPWVPLLSGAAAAAAVLFIVFQPASVKQIPAPPLVAAASPAIVLKTEPRPVKRVHRRHWIAPMKTPDPNWALPEPAIQIAIPVEAMFPPGAVPEGITFIAEVSMAADGSVRGVRLQP